MKSSERKSFPGKINIAESQKPRDGREEQIYLSTPSCNKTTVLVLCGTRFKDYDDGQKHPRDLFVQPPETSHKER